MIREYLLIISFLVLPIFKTFLLGEEVKFIVDAQMDEIRVKMDKVDRKIRSLQNQLSNMNQVYFNTPFEAEVYLQQKSALRIQIARLLLEYDAFNKILLFLKNKKEIFTRNYLGKQCIYFYSDPINPGAYDSETEKVAELFYKKFPGVSFNFQSKPQILIYPSKKDYSLYEDKPEEISGHQISLRACEMGAAGNFFGPSNLKIYLVATYAQASFNVFHHEITHLFVSKLVDPLFLSAKSKQAYSFINEGFAENIAAVFNEKVYEERVNPLCFEEFNESRVASAIADDIEEYRYSEGALFVRWLSTIPNSFTLIKKLLSNTGKEVELIIRDKQTERGLDRIGFKEYYGWRNQELKRIQSKLFSNNEASASNTVKPPSPALTTSNSTEIFYKIKPSENIICSKDVDAYDYKQQLIRKFKAGSKLKILSINEPPGWVHVKLDSNDGKSTFALCRFNDIAF